jgi:hypothetical protein
VDFIERLLGISPDVGSGATELALIFAPLLILLLWVTRRYLRRTFRHETSDT